mgnify:CR=1 FL=1
MESNHIYPRARLVSQRGLVPNSSYGAVKILTCTSVYPKHQDFYMGFKHLCVSICSNLTVTFGATRSRMKNTVLH